MKAFGEDLCQMLGEEVLVEPEMLNDWYESQNYKEQLKEINLWYYKADSSSAQESCPWEADRE